MFILGSIPIGKSKRNYGMSFIVAVENPILAEKIHAELEVRPACDLKLTFRIRRRGRRELSKPLRFGGCNQTTS